MLVQTVLVSLVVWLAWPAEARWELCSAPRPTGDPACTAATPSANQSPAARQRANHSRESRARWELSLELNKYSLTSHYRPRSSLCTLTV